MTILAYLEMKFSWSSKVSPELVLRLAAPILNRKGKKRIGTVVLLFFDLELVSPEKVKKELGFRSLFGVGFLVDLGLWEVFDGGLVGHELTAFRWGFGGSFGW